MTLSLRLWGPLSPLGLAVAAGSLVIDQTFKYFMLFSYGMAARGRVPVTPFLDLVMVWNRGISYGLFPQESDLGRWVLISIKITAALLLTFLLARAAGRLAAVSFGLIIGGALANAIDRLVHGAVADFFLLHWGELEWYVFNLADVAIIAGVAGLLYDSLANVEKTP